MKISIETTNIGGVLEITSPEWGGKIIKMPRKVFIDWRDKGNLPTTAAVYALYADHFNKGKFGTELYIGHTASIEKRVFNHLTEKDFWTILLVFVSEKDWMNIAYTQNIEFQLIKMAKNANRYDIKNGNDGSKTHLGEEDKKRLDNFLEGLPFVLEMAGIDIFTFNLDGVYEKCTLLERSSIRVVNLEHKKIEVLAGSIISYFDLNEVSIPEDVIIEKNNSRGGICKFEKDTVVKINDDLILKLFGNSLSGWKNKCGIKLSTVFK